jgi:hypothetical protein
MKAHSPESLRPATHDPLNPWGRPDSSWRFPAAFPAELVAFSSGFIEENPQGVNPIILWINLWIVELGFHDFIWGFSTVWPVDFVYWFGFGFDWGVVLWDIVWNGRGNFMGFLEFNFV